MPVLVLTPPRPLWPAGTILGWLERSKPGHRLITRAARVYSVYAQRSDSLANVRALLPPGLKVVGFMAFGDDMDVSLWRPYFSRRVLHLTIQDSGADIRSRGIEYAIVGGAYLNLCQVPLSAWLDKCGAEVIGSATATLKVTEGPQQWYLVRFHSAGTF